MEEIKGGSYPLYFDFIEKKKLEEIIQRKKTIYIRKYDIELVAPNYYKPISKLIDFNDI